MSEDTQDGTNENNFASKNFVNDEILRFPHECPKCGNSIETLMKPTDVPHFEMVIIMATNCPDCGYRTNEVQSGGRINEQGCYITLNLKENADFNRDVLKSDSCSLIIPELELEAGRGVLSGRFTTVEGLLTATKEQLSDLSRLSFGDLMTDSKKRKMDQLVDKFDDILALKFPITLTLDDPAGNSFIQSLTAPLIDDRLTKVFYDRSHEQNDDLGLNNLLINNYQQLEDIHEQIPDADASLNSDQ